MPSSCPPSELTRITTRYVAAEDRVRLAGERAGGKHVVIWLTLRLLQRLVPKLLLPLDSASVSTSAGRELILGFAHQKALASHVPVAPVAPPSDADSWLAERASISRSPQALSVTFESADDETASLTLSPIAVHQWLAILYRAYCSAQWPMDIWPLWLIESLEPEPKLSRALH